MNGISGTRSAFPLLKVTGWDGPDGGGRDGPVDGTACRVPPPGREELWQVEGSVRSSNTALVDFSARGGVGGSLEPVLVTYEGGKITFPDGNKWKKRSDEPKERRPKDLSTLGSGPRFRERDDDE